MTGRVGSAIQDKRRPLARGMGLSDRFYLAFVPPCLFLAVVLTTLCGVVSAGPFGVVAANAQMTSPPSEEKQPPKPRSSANNPVSGNPEAIDAGRKLYVTWCIQCHGPKADGVSRFGKYAADLREFWRGYREFVTIVKNGRTDRQMPPWKEVLDDAKIAQLAAFLETLAVEGANWK